MTTDQPTTKQQPDPSAAVIQSLGELDGVPEGVAVRVKMDGPTTPPYDEVGGALDRAHRQGLKTYEVLTDGGTRRVGAAAAAIAHELDYRHLGHLVSGRHQPDDRMQKIDRDLRLEWHLRTLRLAGLDAEDSETLRIALGLRETDQQFEQSCDEMDERNRRVTESWLSGVDARTGAEWKIQGPLGFRWKAFTLTATLPDGRVVSGKANLSDYVGDHLARLITETPVA